MIYKRCIFLRVKSKQHVLVVYGHHQVLCQLRFRYINYVNCIKMWGSQHRIIVEIYLCIGGYYARLICSVTPVVQGSHLGVCTTGATLHISLAQYPPIHRYISTIIRWGDLHIITQFTQFSEILTLWRRNFLLNFSTLCN